MLKNKHSGIINEPSGGAHRNVNFIFESIKKYLKIAKELESKY